jgi:SAM-dependent methyltransferase
MIDQRSDLYRSLHNVHSRQEGLRLHSAERVLQTVFQRFAPTSLLDVGCGVGLWLAAAERLGIADLAGVEGPWVRDAAMHTDPTKIIVHDLERAFDLERRFDLVISIEVAEHLPETAADLFIRSLTRHSDFVLFSAAIPGQGGTGHQNEQFPDYWAARFATYGYQPLDFVRRSIWSDRSVQVWLRQNVIPFASARFLAENSWTSEFAGSGGPMSIVHPDLFTMLRSKLVGGA